MPDPKGARSVVIQVWEHGGVTVARATDISLGERRAEVRLTGQDDIVGWFIQWLQGGGPADGG